MLIFFLGCATKIQHYVNAKLTLNTDVNLIFILNRNATSLRRRPDVISTPCACWVKSQFAFHVVILSRTHNCDIQEPSFVISLFYSLNTRMLLFCLEMLFRQAAHWGLDQNYKQSMA